MTPFVVVRVDDEKICRGAFNATGRLGGNVIFNMMMQEEHTDYSGELNNKINYYQTNTLETARALANKLAERYVGTAWAIAQCSEVIRSEPGPITRAVFTDQGLLPAV